MIVDANVFLEVLLGQQYRAECRALLEALERGERDGTVTAYHVDVVAYIVEQTATADTDIPSFLASLMLYDGLSVRNQSLPEKLQACRVMDETGLDFDDSLAVQAATSVEANRIVTLDAGFDSVDTLESVHPAEL